MPRCYFCAASRHACTARRLLRGWRRGIPHQMAPLGHAQVSCCTRFPHAELPFAQPLLKENKLQEPRVSALCKPLLPVLDHPRPYCNGSSKQRQHNHHAWSVCHVPRGRCNHPLLAAASLFPASEKCWFVVRHTKGTQRDDISASLVSLPR